MQISPHFTRAEMACRCGCGFDSIDAQTLEILEAVRTHFDAPVTITSAARCPDHNARVGGVPDSQHVRGRAADIQVSGISPAEAHAWIADHYPSASLGLYVQFVHVDTRSDGPARWTG